MRLRIVVVLVLALAALMGMKSENADSVCEASAAYRAGLDGKEKPEFCKIGKASVAFENWLRGRNERSEKLKLETSRAPADNATN